MPSAGIQISPDNQGPIINIISWILLVVTCLATLTTIWSKWGLTKKLQADDYYLTGAMLTAVGWIGAVSIQEDAGLGRHLSTMSPEDIVRFQQASYSSQFLYIISLGLAKMAILHFLLSLARVENRRRAVSATMAFNVLSMVAGIFAVAFQCPLPNPWEILSHQCFDQTSFWITFGVLDILVDVATAVLPFVLLHDLRTKWKRKLPAILAFALRFLLVPMIIVRLVYLKSSADSTDHPFDDFSTALTTSVHITFSVIVTCLPFLKTVMDNIQSGYLSGGLRGRNATQGYGYRMGQSIHHTGGGMSLASPSRSRGYYHERLASPNETYNGQRSRTYSGSSGERMVINQTTTISLASERIHTGPEGPF